MQEFKNEIIDISTLPKFEDVKLQPLQKEYFKVMLIQRSVFYTIFLIPIIALFFIDTNDFFEGKLIYGLLFWFVLVLLNFFYLKLSFRKKGFALREHDVIFKSGVISETTTIVTNNRVQHVALHQGMLSRIFGLASIELFTAGGSASDLKINGLLFEDAKKIKESVSERIIEITEEAKEQSVTLETEHQSDYQVIPNENNEPDDTI
ncbi:PH domain-containing protein [Flavobacterium jejuense]|uniref:PH domain-containing protein n=1 Tax=Flavobacterium jejuense TaxID=1544455 RepID=A0ABX0IK48_9FLAO|nr:PH domain-containing protein [Flavobacterium jejuense]NHN24202.1 PH domain-containing protein [Flavobacterium jejuense]